MNNDIYSLLEAIAEQLTTVKSSTTGLTADFIDFKHQISSFNENQSQLIREMQHTQDSLQRFELNLKETNKQSSDSARTANEAIHNVETLVKEFERLKEELIGRINSIEGLFGDFRHDVEEYLNKTMTDEEFKAWEVKNQLSDAALQVEKERRKREQVETELKDRKTAYKAAFDWTKDFFKAMPPTVYVGVLVTFTTVLFPKIKAMAITLWTLFTGS